jgi:flagellar hook-associated protein FlgK|tara:strand:+ start:2999 stop:3319 length:321 start_codon:yes stop_codon:yes gene_type:complete
LSISGVLSTAVTGLHASSVQFRTAANNIVNANTPNYEAKEVRTISQVAGSDQGNTGGVTTTIIEGGDVSLVSEYINMTQAKISYTATAEVIATSEELVGSLLDITS